MTSEVLPIHRALATQLSVMIYWEFFEDMKEVVKKDREEDPVFFNVGEMGASGKAKSEACRWLGHQEVIVEGTKTHHTQHVQRLS